MWNSPIPETRWTGLRRDHRGVEAFKSLTNFEQALVSELQYALSDHDAETLGRLLHRNKKSEIELFIRTHGPNPIFDPQKELDVEVGVARADIVPLATPATAEANAAILNGDVVHVLFQAGEASRFQAGPLYALKPLDVSKDLVDGRIHEEGIEPARLLVAADLTRISVARAALSPAAAALLVDGSLGPKQPLLIRAAIRRVIHEEMSAGRLTPADAPAAYQRAIAAQKILFFVSRRNGVSEMHDESLRQRHKFYGFDPRNLVTIEQELVRGVVADETGRVSILDDATAADAAGHLYALIQAARDGDFTAYTESGRPQRPEVDALSYLSSRGGRILSVIRINDMDRHTTEIVNARALSYALGIFARGYVNAVETVANTEGQKGGTGTTFGDSETHVLTETHENSFPSLSRAFELARQRYLVQSGDRHPSYNAMRQWADLSATRHVLREYGARIVFVPRQKVIDGVEVSYLGSDMPMGDLSLLCGNYRSRMFQFSGPGGRELQIHDMKKRENLPIATRTLLHQLGDPHVRAAAEELSSGALVAFAAPNGAGSLYGAPVPEFE